MKIVNKNKNYGLFIKLVKNIIILHEHIFLECVLKLKTPQQKKAKKNDKK